MCGHQILPYKLSLSVTAGGPFSKSRRHDYTIFPSKSKKAGCCIICRQPVFSSQAYKRFIFYMIMFSCSTTAKVHHCAL